MERARGDVVNRELLADREAVVGAVILDHPSLGIARVPPWKMKMQDGRVGDIARKRDVERHARTLWSRGRAVRLRLRRCRYVDRRAVACRPGGIDRAELKGGTGYGAEGNSACEDRQPADVHRRPHNAIDSRIGTKQRDLVAVDKLSAWSPFYFAS